MAKGDFGPPKSCARLLKQWRRSHVIHGDRPGCCLRCRDTVAWRPLYGKGKWKCRTCARAKLLRTRYVAWRFSWTGSTGEAYALQVAAWRRETSRREKEALAPHLRRAMRLIHIFMRGPYA